MSQSWRQIERQLPGCGAWGVVSVSGCRGSVWADGESSPAVLGGAARQGWGGEGPRMKERRGLGCWPITGEAHPGSSFLIHQTAKLGRGQCF